LKYARLSRSMSALAACIQYMTIVKDTLSVFWNVKVPRRSYWVPFDVTVKLRVTAAQEPTAPQSLGGLHRTESKSTRSISRDYPRVLDNFWTGRED
jgi:hypothetical protein